MSSLFAAMGVAVSGLNAQSQSIGNISDDLANAETTGYKSIGTSFSALVTASSATNNSPGGVTATPRYQNDVQGNISSTATITNLAISGQGFFTVTSASQSASGTTEFTGSAFYTRVGDFTLNKDGYMVNGSGYYLEGYTITNGIADTSSVSPIQISSLLDNPEASTKITYVANLPSSATVGYASSTSTVNVYDAQGSTHQAAISWEKVDVNRWIASVSVEDGSGTGVTYNTQALVVFNSSSPSGTVQSVTPLSDGTLVVEANSGNPTAEIDISNVSTSAQLPQTISFEVTPAVGSYAGDLQTLTYTTSPGDTPDTVGANMLALLQTYGVTATYSSGALTIDDSSTFGTVSISTSATAGYSVASAETTSGQAGIGLNLTFPGTGSQLVDLDFGELNRATGITQYANASSTVSVSSISQDGLGEGSYSSIGIDSDGVVSINYTNGSTRKIYQIPIATFNSPNNLQRNSGGVYTATLASGSANLHLANTNGSGSITSSSLESSDVDIAGEFTKMIQSQQVYSANAKVVSTVNGMLNTIIQTVQ